MTNLMQKEVVSLAQEIVQAIREAEKATALKEKEAREQADKIIADAKAEAESMIKSRVNQIKQETSASLESAGASNQELITKAKEEAEAEIKELRDKVAQQKNSAIDAVIADLIG